MESITNPKESVSMDAISVKRGDIQGINGQVMVRTLPNEHRVLPRKSNFEGHILFLNLNSQLQ
ncbi:hypothetical protein JHK84_028862 [Glycine max]|nr:hypothetical protein JHK84_028862 [Glycine max]